MGERKLVPLDLVINLTSRAFKILASSYVLVYQHFFPYICGKCMPAALRPTTDEIEQAKAEARKKMIPCPRCFSLRTKFHSFSNYNLSKDKRICRDCKRLWVVGASLRN